jgi:hypothetical protein
MPGAASPRNGGLPSAKRSNEPNPQPARFVSDSPSRRESLGVAGGPTSAEAARAFPAPRTLPAIGATHAPPTALSPALRGCRGRCGGAGEIFHRVSMIIDLPARCQGANHGKLPALRRTTGPVGIWTAPHRAGERRAHGGVGTFPGALGRSRRLYGQRRLPSTAWPRSAWPSRVSFQPSACATAPSSDSP